MKTIAVIGCGGINSWFVKHLKEVMDTFYNNQEIFVRLYDEDIVEEKNILRFNQNFNVGDLMLNKAEVLAERYKFTFDKLYITEENISLLDSFDDIIIGVDNHKTRRLLYKYCLEKGKYLLDLRAMGTQMMYVVLDNTKTIEYYDELYFSNIEIMDRKGSCQLTKDVENDHIENANKLIAIIGAYGIYLKQLRKELPITHEWKAVY